MSQCPWRALRRSRSPCFLRPCASETGIFSKGGSATSRTSTLTPGGGFGDDAHLDVAEAKGADLAIVVNPLVPVSTQRGTVPTGHGVGESVRDKGMLWTYNQAMRIGAHARLHQDAARYAAPGGMRVLVLEPRPSDALLFMHNPAASIPARRAILEYAYRTTRERIAEWTAENEAVIGRLGWKVGG